MKLFDRGRAIAFGVFTAATLLAVALPASAATTTVLNFIGSVTGPLAIDTSGLGNDGTLHNVTATGAHYSFGTDAYISVPASSTINPGRANTSYGVTMRLPAGYIYTHDLSLVRRGASTFAGAYYKMELDYRKATGNTVLVCAMRDQKGHTGYVSTTATGLNDGDWHTLKCSRTATRVSLSKDAATTKKAARVGNLSSNRQLTFGAEKVTDTTFSGQFPGDMDSIKLTKRVSDSTTTVLNYIGTVTDPLAFDVSGQGNDGTLHNVTSTGEYYSFGGGLRYISVPASSTINPDTEDYTYGVTMRLPANYTYTRDLSLVRRGSSKFAGAYYKMELIYKRDTGNTVLVCEMRDQNGNAGYVSTTATGLNDGDWHTLKCSKTSTSLSLSKDAATYTNAATVGNLSSNRPLIFGAEQIDETTFWEQFPGDMDSIVITKG